MKQKAKLVTGLIIGFLAAIGLDQWTKLLAVNHLMDRPAYVIWDGVGIRIPVFGKSRRGLRDAPGKTVVFPDYRCDCGGRGCVLHKPYAGYEEVSAAAFDRHVSLCRRSWQYDRPVYEGLCGGLFVF